MIPCLIQLDFSGQFLFMDCNKERENLIKILVSKGIKDQLILSVIGSIPRELFVPDNLQGFAYEDKPLSIGYGQTISQPFIVAYMTLVLKIKNTHRILEIGTGSGYQTAILTRLAKHVYTVERISQLIQSAYDRLKLLSIDNVSFHLGDGSVGWKEESPFDRIIVTAATPKIPTSLLAQLGTNGKLIVPVSDTDPEKNQQLVLVTKDNDIVRTSNIGDCMFVKLIGKEGFRSFQ